MILENINYFQEVVNPLYAFPVVGVVLCALLVFAFGFKTPAQPPSFDFVDDRKVANKKKSKPKEVKASKPFQNGNAHASEPAINSTSKSQTSSTKPAKTTEPAATKKTIVENKTKSKKTSAVTPNTTQAKAPEETTDVAAAGEWTKQLSRKDRKNRKGKDTDTKPTIPHTISPKKRTPSPTLIEPTAEIDKPIEPVKEIAEPPKETQIVVEEIAPIVVEAKEIAPSPKKAKKKPVPETILQAPELIVQSDPPQVKEEAAPAPKESSKKSKKAAKEASKAEKTSKDVTTEEATKEKEKMPVAEMEIKLPEKPVVVEKKVPLPPIAAEEPAADPPADKESAKASTNVVFDELGDMWQDAKPQKKKKKVRRE